MKQMHLPRFTLDNRNIIICLYLIVRPLHLCASNSDTSTLPKAKLNIFPIAYYTPETNFAFGFFSAYTFYTGKKSNHFKASQVQFGAAYTLNKQVLFYLPFRIYSPNGNYNCYGELGYYKYSFYFFGIGNQSSKSNKELYKVNFPRIKLNALIKMNEKSFLGLRYWFENYSVTQTEENKALSSGKIIGTGLNRTSGLGPIYNFDSRDHIFYPGRGKLIDVGFQFFNKRLGSDFNFQNFTIDASSYFTITKTQILALNLYSVNIIGKEIPFNQLALLGGNKKMRGYLEGRFRDKNLLSIGAEYRFKLFKRFGACLFANAGEVYHSGIELFKFIKPSLGSGLRYQINKAEKINIRLDYAIGPGQSAFYLTLGEAF